MRAKHSAAEWKAFRLFMFEHDGGVCCHCGRSLEGQAFQVHHKRYVAGREPWEYPPNDCETLCQGCHAAVHGKAPPRVGWRYVADEDLEELAGACEILRHRSALCVLHRTPGLGRHGGRHRLLR